MYRESHQLVTVSGLVSMPAIQHDIHDVLVNIVSSSLSGSNTNTKVGSIKTSLNSLVKSETL